ncbi:MAG TPA: hypothetical protein VI197_00455 [Polyangiaceae bacterium]
MKTRHARHAAIQLALPSPYQPLTIGAMWSGLATTMALMTWIGLWFLGVV